MLTELIEHIRGQGGRKLFVKVSDYESEEDGAIYAAALHLYQSLGFSVELTHNNYYDEGEAQIILGMRLKDAPEELDVQPENCPVQFNSVFEIAETDDAYSFGWHDEGESLFTKEDVLIGLDDVRSKQGRAVFLSFPANFTGVHEALLAAGFSESGVLKDYYEDGIDEQHFVYRF
jgi:ribosomal protein S18 acetylase RimI-like enzyme